MTISDLQSTDFNGPGTKYLGINLKTILKVFLRKTHMYYDTSAMLILKR